MVTKNDFKIVVLKKDNITVQVRDYRSVSGYEAMRDLIEIGYIVVGVRYPQRH